MGQGEHQLLLPQRPQPRPRLRSGGGEIVEVQGGHIVRSTGRKDRHSKVCTAKGPRDRRVRLSAHTAIQFYDVQDRLGYDRPSKAVDWLIKHAKAAIDELDELPPWHPSTASSTSTSTAPTQEPLIPPGDSGKKPLEPDNAFSFDGGSSSGGASLSFLPPSLDSDAIADTIKSFFPMAAATAGTANESSSSYHHYALPAQDLRLSLQSFQDHHVLRHQQAHTAPAPHPIFSFDPGSSSWWNMPAESSGGGGGAYGFGGAPPQAMAMHPMVLGQSQLVTQRGPLQSSNSPSLRAWMDPVNAAAAAASGVLPMLHPSSLPSVSAMGSGGGSGVGFSGFRMPARFQGEEEHDGIADKPSSAPTSHH